MYAARGGQDHPARRRERYRDRHPGGQAHVDFRSVRTGGYVHHAAVRRHRPGARHRLDTGEIDARTHLGGKRFEARQHVSLHPAAASRVTARRTATGGGCEQPPRDCGLGGRRQCDQPPDSGAYVGRLGDRGPVCGRWCGGAAAAPPAPPGGTPRALGADRHQHAQDGRFHAGRADPSGPGAGRHLDYRLDVGDPHGRRGSLPTNRDCGASDEAGEAGRVAERPAVRPGRRRRAPRAVRTAGSADTPADQGRSLRSWWSRMA